MNRTVANGTEVSEPMSKRSIQPNQIFGAVTVLDYDTSKSLWRCRCKCGKITMRSSTNLKTTKYPSCGCSHLILNTLPNQLSLKRSVILSYKANASKKGLQFDLTEEQILDILSKNCSYCGSAPSNKVSSKKRKGRIFRPERSQTFIYSGIDRIDSSVGYTIKNCVPCCSICNISKNDMSLTEWKEWIKKVYLRNFNDYPERE